MAVVGIDVGGSRKGFHGVALAGGKFIEARGFRLPSDVLAWCRSLSAQILAVDAPCAWSARGTSRLAERDLAIGDQVIQCFKTPTRSRARAQSTGFYDWVFNGEELYQALNADYPLFDGIHCDGPLVFETFPHAVVCALAGKVIPAKPKAKVRRQALRDQGYEVKGLSNIDFVDAALCALTAEAFLRGHWQSFGDRPEGYMVIPSSAFTAQQ